MRIAPAIASAVAVLSLAAPSLACGGGDSGVVRRPIQRPVQSFVSSPAEGQRLLRAAAEADATASRREIAARGAERQATQLENQATLTLAQADRSFGRQRQTLLASASSLLDRADDARAESSMAFQEASAFRAHARDLREQARFAVASQPNRWPTARLGVVRRQEI